MDLLRVVFFGSPAFAVPSLRALAERGHNIVAVYTRADSPAGRSPLPQATPVKVAAERMGVSVRTPRSLRDAEAQAGLASLDADVFVVVAYGRLLPPAVLAMPRLGALNVHPSLLPAYRGPSPVQQAVLDGAAVTGVSVMLLDEGMDTGPVLAQAEFRLSGDETGGALMESLFETGAALLADTLGAWSKGQVTPVKQDGARVTVTRLLERSDGDIDWKLPAHQIARMVRAFDPWPGTFTRWRGQVLKILSARAALAPAGLPAPGTVFIDGQRLFAATGGGAVEFLTLQLEGKKAVFAGEFIRGHPAFPGSRLPS